MGKVIATIISSAAVCFLGCGDVLDTNLDPANTVSQAARGGGGGGKKPKPPACDYACCVETCSDAHDQCLAAAEYCWEQYCEQQLAFCDTTFDSCLGGC